MIPPAPSTSRISDPSAVVADDKATFGGALTALPPLPRPRSSSKGYESHSTFTPASFSSWPAPYSVPAKSRDALTRKSIGTPASDPEGREIQQKNVHNICMDGTVTVQCDLTRYCLPQIFFFISLYASWGVNIQ